MRYQKKMFWSSFSFHGVGSFSFHGVMPIEGMMSLDKCIDKVENKLIPDIKRAFPDNEGMFQKDLAPCHSSKKVKTIFRKYKLNLSERLGNSPDLSLIENL